MPTRAELLRLKAEELRVIAEMFRDGNARAQLLMLAEQYERLADRIARPKDVNVRPFSPGLGY